MYNLEDNSDLVCDKCGSGTKIMGALYDQHGIEKYLCGFCHNTFQSMIEKLFDTFMQDNCEHKMPFVSWLSDEAGNILHARMERKAGKNKWS